MLLPRFKSVLLFTALLVPVSGGADDRHLEKRTRGEPVSREALTAAMQHRDRMPRFPGDVVEWEALGPGNAGGRTRALLIHPQNPGIMYAGAVGGGVWKSVNGGASWQSLDDHMANLAVTTLAFEGQGGANVNPNVIYAGTGEGLAIDGALRGGGIFKSTDAGATWNLLPLTANINFLYVSKLAASPNSTGTMYAATYRGVFRTMNAGANWIPVLANSGLGGTDGTQAVSPEGATDIIVRQGISPDLVIAACGGQVTDGIYWSANGGNGWLRTFTTANLGRISLAAAPSNQSVIYALASDASNGHRLLNVFRSTDGGTGWSPRVAGTFDSQNPNWLLLTNPALANLQPCGAGPSILSHAGLHTGAIAVAPHNPDIVFVGGVDMFRSTNGGADWGILSAWWVDRSLSYYNRGGYHALVPHPQWNGGGNTFLYAAGDGGLSGSANSLAAAASGLLGGVCFSPDDTPPSVVWGRLNNGFAVTHFLHGRPLPGGEVYVGGTQGTGVVAGADFAGPNSWIELFRGEGGFVEYDPVSTTTIFIGSGGKRLLRSQGAGTDYLEITATLGESAENFLPVAPFRAGPGSANVLWFGGLAPWCSVNAVSSQFPNGVLWNQVGVPFGAGQNISAWGVSPANENLVFAGTRLGKIFRSAAARTGNDTTVWQDVSMGLPANAYISWIEVDPNDASGATVYATNSIYGQPHVFRTTSSGLSGWTSISGNLPDIPVNCVRVQPEFPACVFIGTDLGVYRTRDGGQTWTPLNHPGFANVVVEALEFSTSGTLFAFTRGRGAFRAEIDSVPVPDTTPPAVTITSPAHETTVTATPVVISGTAVDPGELASGVAQVQVRVNGGAYQTATGTSNWSQSVALGMTANTIDVRARDAAGNFSAVETIVVYYDPPRTVRWEAAALSVDESAGIVELGVILNFPAASVSVAGFPTGGTATGNGFDYEMLGAFVTFTSPTVRRTIPVSIRDDDDPEDDETIILTLSSPVNCTIVEPSSMILTIRDNEFPRITVVSAGGTTIPAGTSSPDGALGTALGSIPLNGGPIETTFTLVNTGRKPLLLGGTPPVALTGEGSGQFAVPGTPPSSVAPLSTEVVTLIFAPDREGHHRATFALQTNDPDQTEYTFAIGATATCPAGAGSGPDLDAQWLIVPAKSCNRTGTRCFLRGRVEIRNIGDAPSVRTRLRFLLSGDEFPGDGDLLLREVRLPAMKPGRIVRRTIKYRIPAGFSVEGRYVIAVADPDGLVGDPNPCNHRAIHGPLAE